MKVKLLKRFLKSKRKREREDILGRESEGLKEDEKDMIRGVLELGETPVKAIMVPRTDVIALSADEPFDSIVKTIVRGRHSRIPIYEGSIDNVIGFLHVKDLIPYLARGETEVDVKKLLRPILFVPEGKLINDLLREFQQRKEHIAVVVDEYGGMAGIVCLEDVIEEIVGEIQDEYDQEEEEIKKVSDDTYICDARTLIEDINEQLQLNLPMDDSDTLGGFVFNLFGKIPEVKESIGYDNVEFTVDLMDGNRIKKVRVSKKSSKGEKNPR
jgi:CBS domain containing-hemolysin-like protein